MNRSNQQAYDRGTSLYSPDGRIYQVEYAREAVERGAPVVGVRTTDGVAFAAKRRTRSSLMVGESVEKLYKIDDHVGAASAGHVADARKLVDAARRESQVERLRYGEPIGVEALTTTVTDRVQENTQRGGTRPYGAALLLGGVDASGPRLFSVDPSGTGSEWKAVAIGGGRESIQEALESGYSTDLDLDAGLRLALGAITVDDDERSADGLTASAISDDGYRTIDADAIADLLADEGAAEDDAGDAGE
ncbi:archaeal proteasome endopeptidase complex subunit alpha [Halegenticoccus tardaugens]|uniref:archaeal proteasome endopeptidase complex subunit alpha n=1 Tax=Halegenticoccus tardaugens TaxID=2071624 RepID=UPI00100AF634|nr:archaeal proteasome endopeptidase complex subunit alpha [Halegenticoccus tardaugens]